MSWQIFRMDWRRLCRWLYLGYVPIVASNLIGFFWALQAGEVFIVVAIAIGIILTLACMPLIAMLTRRATFWQVSSAGLRCTTLHHFDTLTWDEITCIRRPIPIPLYTAGGVKRGFFPHTIKLAPSLMEDFEEFSAAIIANAPANHVLLRFVKQPGEYFPESSNQADSE